MKSRIKTEQEFINEFGEHWRNGINWTSSDSMDYLFGREITLPCTNIDNWTIDDTMITEKPLPKPLKTKPLLNFGY